MKEATIHIDNIIRMHNNRGLSIGMYHSDNALEPLRAHLGDSNLHIVASEEHVPAVERSTPKLKEWGRNTTVESPFLCYPIVMTCRLLERTLVLLNSFSEELV